MSIRRTAIAGDKVAVLQRAALQDVRLSYRARGVLCAVLSRPLDWRTSAEQLAKEGSEGRDAIRAALAELVEFGYLRRVRERVEGGRFVTSWDISDDPIEPDPEDVALSQVTPTTDFQPSVSQPSADPPSENQASRVGVETGGRYIPPTPQADTSPSVALVEAMVDGLAERNADLAARLTPLVIAREMPRLVSLGWTPALIGAWARGENWASAGPGAVVSKIRQLAAPRAVSKPAEAARPMCPRHPTYPSGRCGACEQEAFAVPAAVLGDKIAAARAAIQR